MPTEDDDLPRFKPGEDLLGALSDASRMNAPLDRLADLARVVNRERQPRPDPFIIAEDWVGKIVATGPNGEAAPAGNQYWVERQKPKTTLSTGDNLDFAQDDVPGAKKTVKATDLSNAPVPLVVGRFVHIFVLQWLKSPPATFWYFDPGGAIAGLFPVNVAVTSGTAGNVGSATTAPSFAYDVTSVTGVVIASAQSPTWNRPHGFFDAASHGTGYYNAAGTFVLYQVDEVRRAIDCGI